MLTESFYTIHIKTLTTTKGLSINYVTTGRGGREECYLLHKKAEDAILYLNLQ